MDRRSGLERLIHAGSIGQLIVVDSVQQAAFDIARQTVEAWIEDIPIVRRPGLQGGEQGVVAGDIAEPRPDPGLGRIGLEVIGPTRGLVGRPNDFVDRGRGGAGERLQGQGTRATGHKAQDVAAVKISGIHGHGLLRSRHIRPPGRPPAIRVLISRVYASRRWASDITSPRKYSLYSFGYRRWRSAGTHLLPTR